MRRFRTWLFVGALALLVHYAGGLALAVGLACCEPAERAATMECCRTGGDGHMCPLTNRPAGEAPCRVKAGCARGHDELLPGWLFAAPVPDVVSLSPRLEARPLTIPSDARADGRQIPPPGPPPKA